MKPLLFLMGIIVCGLQTKASPLVFDSGEASGTLSPDSYEFYEISVPAGADGWRVVLQSGSGGTNDPDLYIRRGAQPSTSVFDKYSASGTTDSVYYAKGELTAATYHIAIHLPPEASGDVSYTLNSDEFALKKVSFEDAADIDTIAPGEFKNYEIEVPADRDGWRLVLNNRTGGLAHDPDLYVRQDALASINSYTRLSQNKETDTIFITDQELASTTYYIGVYLPADATQSVDFSFYSEDYSVVELVWDPGTATAGTELHLEPNANGGEYLFRIVTENPDHAVWRSALKVNSGEADLYWRRYSYPTISQNYDKSERVGSDGFTHPLSETSGAGQEWFFLVSSTEGADWSFFAGDIHVEDLGTSAADASSCSSLAPVGPEGARFFQTELPVEMLAWRLWVNDGTDATLDLPVYTRPNLAPHFSSSSYYQHTFNGQDLLVPDASPEEFEAGTGAPYFIAVFADPDTSLLLDNRQQTITDVAHQSTTAAIHSTGYHYHTFRIDVPVEQIAWENTSLQISGDPNLVIRENQVPNPRKFEFQSNVAGTVDDSVTIVPNVLTDGTFYVTVYSDTAFEFQFFNGEPVITDIDFSSTTVNDLTNKVGWRFYRILDIDSQVGFLGWRLDLSNHPADTEIYIRRNAVPGWQNGLYNQMSEADFLQDANHEADIWYVGIYQPTTALSAFTLESGPILPKTLTFDGGTDRVESLPKQQWQYYRIDVPETLNGEDVLGWELRLKDWVGGNPQLTVRRAQIPDSSGTSPSSWPSSGTTFTPGYRIGATSDGWTGDYNTSNGATDTVDRVLSMSMGNPLEPGTYYIGVYNQDYSEDCAFTLQSRGIGSGMSLDVVEVTPGSDAIVNNLAPREPAFFKFELATPVSSWQFELDFGATTPNGEGMLLLRKDWLPNTYAYGDSNNSPFNQASQAGQLTNQTELKIQGLERMTLLPHNGETEIPAGTYYAVVISEGNSPESTSRIGTGDVDFIMRNDFDLAVQDLGTLNFGVIENESGTLLPGEVGFYRFTVPTDTQALAITSKETTGTTSYLTLRTDDGQLPRSLGGYGLSGGQPYQHYLTYLGTINISNPPAGEYTMLLHYGQYDSQYEIEIEAQGAEALNFDGGSDHVTGLKPQRWHYYRIDVPETVNGEDVLGWELRVKDWVGGSPQLTVRREQIPNSSGTSPSNWPSSGTTFTPGYQIGASGDGWTGDYNTSNGAADTVDRVLSMSMGNPLEPGTYYIGVYNQDYSEDCAFTLQSRGIGSGMSLDVVDVTPGSDAIVNGLEPREPAFFKFELAAPVTGWQFELDFGATTPNGEGMLLLRKDWLPNTYAYGDSNNSPFNQASQAGQLTNQTELKIQGQERMTLLPYNGETEIPAGTYYVAVISEGNSPTSTDRIGTGDVDLVLRNDFDLGVQDLGTLNVGAIENESGTLLPGEVDFYRFTVPVDTLALAITSTETTAATSYLTVRTDGSHLPRSLGGYGLSGGQPYQHYLTYQGTINISNPPAGEYTMLLHYGQYDSQYEIEIEMKETSPLGFTSQLPAPPSNTVSFDLLSQELEFYELEVPETVNGQVYLGWLLELNMTSGNATVSVQKDRLPLDSDTSYQSGTSSSRLYLGTHFYGYNNRAYDLLPGTWHAQVSASGNAQGTLTSEAIFATELNMDAVQNADGGTHTDTKLIASGEKQFYVVEVPAELDGKEVLGWSLDLEELSGDATVKVSRNVLPINYNVTTYSDSDDTLLMDAAQATPGTYYIEVHGNNATEYVLTSEAITTDDIRRTWAMPLRDASTTTPGLTSPDFGDSGIDASGNTLPNDQGLDIPADQLHYYTVTIPDDNEGLFRIQLDAISGNPDLYIRKDWLAGDEFNNDFELTQNNQTQYANWVAEDSFFEKQLAPGTYYLAVEAASGTNARYRLRLSTGRMQDLPMDGGSLENQVMAGDDWRYYRVDVPLDLPENWEINFTLSQGNVSMYLRDTVPPGYIFTGYGSSIRSWRNDSKNQGTYSDYTSPGIITLSAPQVRPGHTYYIGFRALTDSNFSISSNISGSTMTDPSLIDFYGGSVSDSLSAGETHYYRVVSPADAVRWMHHATHSSDVKIYIEQGSFPSATSSDDAYSNWQSNWEYNHTFSTSWPWVTGESYYIALVNEGLSEENYTFTMNGKNIYTDDQDGNGIPDQWERDTLGSYGYNPLYDYDNDGTPFILEYFFGMNPQVHDKPDIQVGADSDTFNLDFRKTTHTELLESTVMRSNTLLPGSWIDAGAMLELLTNEGETQLWRARIPILEGRDTDFFRLQVEP